VTISEQDFWIAWKLFRKTEEYDNILNFIKVGNFEGEICRAFEQGFYAALKLVNQEKNNDKL